VMTPRIDGRRNTGASLLRHTTLTPISERSLESRRLIA
jgi:hypothetical protein